MAGRKALASILIRLFGASGLRPLCLPPTPFNAVRFLSSKAGRFLVGPCVPSHSRRQLVVARIGLQEKAKAYPLGWENLTALTSNRTNRLLPLLAALVFPNRAASVVTILTVLYSRKFYSSLVNRNKFDSVPRPKSNTANGILRFFQPQAQRVWGNRSVFPLGE